MKKSTLITCVTAGALALGGAPAAPALAGSAAPATPRAVGAATGGYDEPLCLGRSSLCVDAYNSPGDEYVGHDEPSVLFKSGVRGSGNDMTYVVTLPRNPKIQPTPSGARGATWDFQLRATFWFGLTLCDSESAPEYTKTCVPDTDANNLVGTDPSKPDYIGKHPGNAFMELQFYEPGYVPEFEGFGCTATQWCAAMTIDSRTVNQNTGVENTSACNDYILGGPEPVNWAYITRSGRSQAPANPLFTGTFDNPDLSAVDPDVNQDLLMNSGDRIRIHLHDTSAGFRADLTDLSTGQKGWMTASAANGFGHNPLHPGIDDVSAGAVRLPPRILHREPARQHVVGAHVQRRDVRRDRALRELSAGRRQWQLHRSRQPGRLRSGRRRQRVCARDGLDRREDRRMPG
jgi:hypothetical protein